MNRFSKFDTFEVGFLFGMMFVILTQFVMFYVWFNFL